jgi:predicted small lipoprotein YifL
MRAVAAGAAMTPRIARVALALLALLLAGCGYKGDLVHAEKSQDEKAGQVEPEPVDDAAD